MASVSRSCVWGVVEFVRVSLFLGLVERLLVFGFFVFQVCLLINALLLVSIFLFECPEAFRCFGLGFYKG